MTAHASMYVLMAAKTIRAVVLIHGFPFTRAIWERRRNALAQTFCVLSPDLRGAGKSSAPEGPYLMERLAADIARTARRTRHRKRGGDRSLDGRIRRARVCANVYRAGRSDSVWSPAGCAPTRRPKRPRVASWRRAWIERAASSRLLRRICRAYSLPKRSADVRKSSNALTQSRVKTVRRERPRHCAAWRCARRRTTSPKISACRCLW